MLSFIVYSKNLVRISVILKYRKYEQDHFYSIQGLEFLLKNVSISNQLILNIPVELKAKDIPILDVAIALNCTHLLTGDRKDFGFLYGKRVENVLVVSPKLLAEDMVARGIIRPMVLKVLNNLYPSPERIATFKLEYEILRDLNLPGVIKAYELKKEQQHWFIALEDFGGESLANLRLAGNLELVLVQLTI